MQKSPISLLFKYFPALLAVVLMQSGQLLAQEPSLAALTPAFGEMRPPEASGRLSKEPVSSIPEEVVPSAPDPAPGSEAIEPVAFVPVTAPQKETSRHSFWDVENRALFTTVGALAAVDFYATHANLASGGRELNPVTRMFCGSTPALASNFALEAGGVVAVSYLFHKTGHHKLERMTAWVNIGSSGLAAGYSLAHR